ncbi:DUF192 domain-containing protein [Raoultibacter massiliensis]|uniref:DUF192 domain-containing protein n=1 Tax=Raoultibacter massiliensis TaxID=1852371 RepID=UPI000C8500EF
MNERAGCEASEKLEPSPVSIAATAASRMRGLLGTESCSETLFLIPCRGVHTYGMRYPIDVAFANGDGLVVAVRRGLEPNRRVMGGKAVMALEREHDPSRTWFKEGDRLALSIFREAKREESR